MGIRAQPPRDGRPVGQRVLLAVTKILAVTGSLGGDDLVRAQTSGWAYLVARFGPLGSAGRGAYDDRMTTTELAQTIQDRLDVLHREIALLEAARDQLHSDGFGSAQPTVSKPAVVRRTRRARPRRSGAVVSAVKVEALLAEHSGLTSTALAELVNGGRDQVLGVLRELEAAGRARRTGQRRGTRWHAITDEDRISARAAELAKQSKRVRSRAAAAGRRA